MRWPVLQSASAQRLSNERAQSSTRFDSAAAEQGAIAHQSPIEMAIAKELKSK